MADIRKHFEVEQREGVFYVVDRRRGDALPCDSKAQATTRLSFARSYTRYHGDIDLRRFPQSLTEPFDRSGGMSELAYYAK